MGYQPDEKLAALTASVREAGPQFEGVGVHLADLATQAEVMADIASVFASERGDDTAADMLFLITSSPLDQEFTSGTSASL